MPSLPGEGPGWSHLHEVEVAGPGHGEFGTDLGIDLDLGRDMDIGTGCGELGMDMSLDQDISLG